MKEHLTCQQKDLISMWENLQVMLSRCFDFDEQVRGQFSTSILKMTDAQIEEEMKELRHFVSQVADNASQILRLGTSQ